MSHPISMGRHWVNNPIGRLLIKINLFKTDPTYTRGMLDRGPNEMF